MEAMFVLQFLFSRSLQCLFICSETSKVPSSFRAHILTRIR